VLKGLENLVPLTQFVFMMTEILNFLPELGLALLNSPINELYGKIQVLLMMD
jgi:hypothetical protein